MGTVRMWCERCRQSWLTTEPERLGEAPRCFACDGALRPDRRRGLDRRFAYHGHGDRERRELVERRRPEPPVKRAP